jgi:hypothetical protein
VSARPATTAEAKKLHGLGDHPSIASLVTPDGATLEVAANDEDAARLVRA